MKIGLLGGTGKSRSIPYSDERSINLIPIIQQGAREPTMMLGAPGLREFGVAGSGPIREAFRSANGRAFVVSIDGFYEVHSDGSTTLYGALNTSSGNLTADENTTQLMVCDGEFGYIFTYATNSWVQITDADFPKAGTVTYIDGYFVVNKVDSGQFFISALNNGLTWSAPDFATAESSPDRLLRVINAIGQLWLLGEYTTEVYTNTGTSPFPFQRIAGAVLQVGIAAPYTMVTMGNSIFWVGQDRQGRGVVYSARGFSPQRVSTESIEILLQSASDMSNLKAFSYQQDGHVYYVITGEGLETSLVYDLTTQIWHERAYEQNGSYTPWIANCHMYAFGKNLVGDRRSGKVHEMALDIYDDDGEVIVRERTFNHLADEGARIRLNALEIAMETGVGLASGNSVNTDPACQLWISKDAGKTWLGAFTAAIGKIGEYRKRVIFRRLGIGEVFTFRLRIAAKTKIALIGAYLR